MSCSIFTRMPKPLCSKKRTDTGGVTDMHTVTCDSAAASSADVGSMTPT